MSATKHSRILSWIYLGLSVPVLLAGLLVCAFAMIEGAEAGLLLLPGGAMVVGASPFLLMGAGLRWEQRWAVVLAAACGVLLLGGVITAPLGLYSLYVAYLHWRLPQADTPPRKVPYDGAEPHRPVLAPTVTRQALLAHRRILGSAYLLFALYPGYIGLSLLSSWVGQLDEWSAFLDPDILLSLVMLAAAGALLAIVIGLLRGRTWAVWVSLVAALPMARVYPIGTAVAVYACWVAYCTWRVGRIVPRLA